MSQGFSFNLVDEGWIPCVDREGQVVELGLRAVLGEAQRLRMIGASSPLETVAITRLLLAILHRVFGPADEEEWAGLWGAAAFDGEALERYWAAWRHRFDLFDATYPFFQVDDPRKEPKSIVSLKHGVGFLHNELFDHDNEKSGFSLTPAQAARALVAVQTFGLGGLSGIAQKHTDAAGASGVIFLVQGDDLRETLLLNLPAYPERTFYAGQGGDDAPVWEIADPLGDERTMPNGLLDHLTWLNRRVMLYPKVDEGEGVAVRAWKDGPGLRLGEGILDPMKLYYVTKQGGLMPQRFSEDKGLWRDSAALFSMSQRGDMGIVAPASLRWLHSVISRLGPEAGIGIDRTYRCVALGMAKDRGKMLFTRQEIVPLLPHYLADDLLVTRLASALSQARQAAGQLLRAARMTGMHLQLADADGVAWQQYGINKSAPTTIMRTAAQQIEAWVAHTGVERRYWGALDVAFQALVVGLPQDADGARAAWRAAMKRAAEDAFATLELFVKEDGRGFKAMTRGRGALEGGLYRLLVQDYVVHELVAV